jgi:hypothetical protein
MKTPSNCPFCGDPLLNEFIKTVEGACYTNKICNKRLDHKIIIRPCLRNDDYVDWICIPYSKDANILWHMGPGSLIISNTTNGNRLYLPFFQPDLSNHKKLLNKIKTYILFS